MFLIGKMNRKMKQRRWKVYWNDVLTGFASKQEVHLKYKKKAIVNDHEIIKKLLKLYN